MIKNRYFTLIKLCKFIFSNVLAVVLFYISLSSETAFAQKRLIIHPPQAELKLPGLARRFYPVTAKYSIELHPGWLVKETYDSVFHWTSIRCINPKDSDEIFLKVESLPSESSSFDTAIWTELKNGLRDQYGKQEIGTLVLFDSTYLPPSNGILARYELLANNNNRLTYTASIITNTETLMVSVQLGNDATNDRIPYYRSLVANIQTRQ